MPRQRPSRGIGRPRYWWPLLIVGALVVDLPAWNGGVPTDLRIYRISGRAVLRGADLYSQSVHLGPYGFTYPPFAALILVPLAILPGLVAAAVITAVSAGALAAVIEVCVPGLLKGVRSSWVALLLVVLMIAIEPVFATFADGQINLILLALVVVDLIALIDTRWAGVLLGLAIGIKLTPGIFVLYLFARRRWRAIGTTIASALFTLLLGVLLMPGDARQYWTKQLWSTTRIGDPARVDNQSLLGAVRRALGHTAVATVVWLTLAVAVLVGTYVIVRRLVERGDHVLAVGLVGVAGCLVSPIAWTHHWVWFVPVLLGLHVSRLPDRFRHRALVVVAVVALVGAGREAFAGAYKTELGRATLGDIYVITGVWLLVAAGFAVGVPRRSPTTTTTAATG